MVKTPGMVGGGKKGKRGKGLSWYEKKYSAKEVAMKAWSAVKYVKELVNAETKSITTTVSLQDCTFDGTITHLSAIAQGITLSNRIGQSVFTKSLFIRGCVSANATTANDLVRIIIFRDTQNTGTAPVPADVIQVVGLVTAPLTPMRREAHGRFRILYSSLMAFSNTGSQAKLFKAYIPLKKHIKYTGAASTDEQKNQIYMLSLGSGNSNNPDLSFVSRLSFYDN